MSAVDALVAELRERILDGALPPGQRLREVAVAGEHGVARHTVRAALRALAGEGLVRLEANRGASVVAMDADAVVALYELRAALEIEAAHLALTRHGGRLPDAVHTATVALAEVCARRRPAWPAVSRAHGGVHAAIVRAARTPRIEAIHARLETETRLFLLQVRPHYTPERLAWEHAQLVEGIERDGPEVLRDHLRASAALLVDELDRRGV